MKGITRCPSLPINSQVLHVCFTLFSFAILGLAVGFYAPNDISNLLWPSIATLLNFYIFSILLLRRARINLIGEIGFIYCGFLVLYTLIPVYNFINGNFSASDPISLLQPKNSEITLQLWRQELFILAFTLGYLLLRGWKPIGNISKNKFSQDNHRTIIFISAILLISLYYLVNISSGVDNYYESYMRYEGLDFIPRKIVSIAIRFKEAVYSALLTFLFLNYKRYRIIIPIFIIGICFFEIVFSFGARIQSFLIIVQCLLLYNFTVNKLKLKFLISIGVIFAIIFSAMELIRLIDFDTAKNMLSEDGIKPPWELNAVFYSGFHLYQERANGTIPVVEWQMFINDFLVLIPFYDFPAWNPMNWYFINYHPYALVAPYTLGPIADSAIWGGEFDLFLRGIINGLFFAFIARWFIKYKNTWWALAAYTFLCANSIMTIKYSIFYSLSLIFKTIVPMFLIISLYRNYFNKKNEVI